MDRRPDQGPLARRWGTREGGPIGEGEERNDDDGNAGDAAPPRNRRADRHGKSTQDNSKSESTSSENDSDSDGSGDPDKEEREAKEPGRRQGLNKHENTEGWLIDGMQRENGRSGTQRKKTKQVERAQNKIKDSSENRKERGTPATRSSQRQKSNRESQAREKEKITRQRLFLPPPLYKGQRSREGEKSIPWRQKNKSQGAHRIEQEPRSLRSKARESAPQPRLRNAKVAGL